MEKGGNSKFQFLSDENLLTLLRESNDLAFNQIYNRYWKRLMAYTINIVNDRSLAEDILHDLFTNLWIRRDTLKIDNLEKYLFVAAKHKSISFFRKIKFTKLDESIIKSLIPLTNEADANIIKNDLNLVIAKAIKELPKKCRVIFYMSKYQDYSSEEIAKHFNISHRTVENQLSIALKHLKRVLLAK